MSSTRADRSQEAPRHPTRKWQFPSAFTVLAGVTLVVWVLAFVIPTGRYEVDAETGAPIPGSYQPLTRPLLRGPAVRAVLGTDQRPVRRPGVGRGFIGPYETGELFGQQASSCSSSPSASSSRWR